jgi:hypothetical protein
MTVNAASAVAGSTMPSIPLSKTFHAPPDTLYCAMRSLLLVLAFVICSVPAFAIDWNAIGKPLDDDSKKMRDRYVYFDGNTTSQNIGIDKPVINFQDIQDWVSQRAAETLTLDGPHYEQQIAVQQRNFTSKGYGEYIASLEASQIPKLLKDQHYTMRAIVMDPPNVVANGLRDEGGDKTAANYKEQLTYIWIVDVPVNMTYHSMSGDTVYKIYLTVELKRIPMQADNNNALIAINAWQFSAKPRKTKL